MTVHQLILELLKAKDKDALVKTSACADDLSWQYEAVTSVQHLAGCVVLHTYANGEANGSQREKGALT